MAAISARTLIEDALHENGVLGVGQAVNSAVETRAFRRLNNMLESLSLSHNKIYVDTEETQTLTTSQARYTVGSSGDFDTNRPLKVYNDAFIRTPGGTDYPILLRTQNIYREQTTKTITARPYLFTYTPEFPLGKFSFYPTPGNSVDAIHYRANVLLDSFSTVTSEVSFAPGYQLAIMLSLSASLLAQNGKRITNELALSLQAAWSDIESTNALREAMVPVQLNDLTLINNRVPWGDIYTGPYY